MSTLFSDNFNRADSATVDATNWTENAAGDWAIVSNKVRSINPLTTLVTKTAAHAAVADCKVTVKRALTGTNWDVGLLVRANGVGATTTGYFADPLGTGPSSTLDIWRIDGALSTDVQIGGTVTVDINDGDIYAFEVSGTGATVTLKAYINGVLKLTVTDSSASRIVAAGQTGLINWNNTNDFDDFLVEDLGAAPATLSSPTPSGTLGTSTTASPGASTDTTSGTGYVVVDSAANISGITAAQVKAGQNNASATAVASANAAISASPFTIAVSGLTANTAYGYAVVQNSAGGDSNVVTGTFTTAVASASTNQRLMLLGVG